MSKEITLITCINIAAFICAIFYILGIQDEDVAHTFTGLISFTWLMWIIHIYQARNRNTKRA